MCHSSVTRIVGICGSSVTGIVGVCRGSVTKIVGLCAVVALRAFFDLCEVRELQALLVFVPARYKHFSLVLRKCYMHCWRFVCVLKSLGSIGIGPFKALAMRLFSPSPSRLRGPPAGRGGSWLGCQVFPAIVTASILELAGKILQIILGCAESVPTAQLLPLKLQKLASFVFF